MNAERSRNGKKQLGSKWRERMRRTGRIVAEETLRGLGTAAGTATTGTLIIWWQSRH